VWAATGQTHKVDYKYADDASLSGTIVYWQPGIDISRWNRSMATDRLFAVFAQTTNWT